MQLTEIKALLGSVNQTKTVMGFISQLEDGQYFIEDLSGALKVDLSDAMTAAGFYVGKIPLIFGNWTFLQILESILSSCLNNMPNIRPLLIEQ